MTMTVDPQRIKDLILSELGYTFMRDTIDEDCDLFDLGLDSAILVEILLRLECEVGLSTQNFAIGADQDLTLKRMVASIQCLPSAIEAGKERNADH